MSPAERLMRETCDAMKAFQSNLGTEVTLPNIYPWGEFVRVVVVESGADVLIHDGGFALHGLAASGARLKKSAFEELEAFASRMGCSVRDGRIYRFATPDKAALAAMTVSSVCQFASNLAQAPKQEQEDFAAIVREVVEKRLGTTRLKPRFSVVGESGASYEVTAAIVQPKTKQPAALIEAVATPRSVNGKFRHLYDIHANDAYFATDKIAVYNDRKTFPSSDLILLQNVGNVVAYSDLMVRVEQYAA